jgi:hypothetical protein
MGLIGLACLWYTRRAVAGTTLVGPWIWGGISFLVIGAALSFIAWHDEPAPWKSALQFAAVTSSFCPAMSLLGAKRPQDKAWHFIVLSLWIVVALPAAENLVLRPGQALDVRGARSWFVAALIVLGFINMLPTRYSIAAMQLALGQALMLAEFLPLMSNSFQSDTSLAGFGLCLTVPAWAVARHTNSSLPLDRLWLDFRDCFGLLWGLRFQEQINKAAEMHDWPLRLRWDGFRSRAGDRVPSAELPAEVASSLRQNLDNLLRRFVSQDWISQRVDESLD